MLPEIQAVDLLDWNAGGLERLEQRLQRHHQRAGARLPAATPSRSPYPGIHAFEAEDAAIYFGRDDETRAVIERLDARRTQGGARLLVIIGASGLGQVVAAAGRRAAAARAAARATGSCCRRSGPRRRRSKRIAKAIAEQLGKPQDWRSWHERLGRPDAVDDVDELLKDLRVGEARNATVLLPIDQFEEVFTVATPAERDGVPASALRGARSGARPAAAWWSRPAAPTCWRA